MKAWIQLESWLAAHAPSAAAALSVGASEEELNATEAALGVQLPEDAKRCYRLHNGETGDIGVLGGVELLSLSRVVEEWSVWMDLLRSGDIGSSLSSPEGPIQSHWWHPRWIPVTHDGGGNHACLDLAPALGGRVGQIIEFWHDSSERRVLAPSFSEYLMQWAENLEQGGFRWTSEGFEEGKPLGSMDMLST